MEPKVLHGALWSQGGIYFPGINKEKPVAPTYRDQHGEEVPAFPVRLPFPTGKFPPAICFTRPDAWKTNERSILPRDGGPYSIGYHIGTK